MRLFSNVRERPFSPFGQHWLQGSETVARHDECRGIPTLIWTYFIIGAAYGSSKPNIFHSQSSLLHQTWNAINYEYLPFFLYVVNNNAIKNVNNYIIF